jgi:hypothetical protein
MNTEQYTAPLLQGMYDFYKPIQDKVGMGIGYAQQEGKNMYRDFKKIFPPYPPNIKGLKGSDGLNQSDVDMYYKDYLSTIPTTQWAQMIDILKGMDSVQVGQ